MKQTITLTIAGTDFKFNMTVQDHSDFVDSVARGGSMTAASHNMVMRTITDEQKPELKKVLESSPGSELQIASMLKTEFSPVLEIAVKK
ncbi:putative phage tail assembly chaperone [Pseudoalteromonas sp.]|uniref:putative phage tail assembly chaperone n=1 Tax=Pseudoalteromonas sp. TaxID=53249 RepID=UPI003567D4F6